MAFRGSSFLGFIFCLVKVRIKGGGKGVDRKGFERVIEGAVRRGFFGSRGRFLRF